MGKKCITCDKYTKLPMPLCIQCWEKIRFHGLFKKELKSPEKPTRIETEKGFQEWIKRRDKK